MKIRNGFVSNSSSSSFVAVVEVNAFKELRKTLNRLEKKILDFMKVRKKKLGEVEYVLLHDYLYTEEPDPDGMLEEMYEKMGDKKLKEMLSLDDDVDVGDVYIRNEIFIGVIENVRSYVQKLERNGLAIAHWQDF